MHNLTFTLKAYAAAVTTLAVGILISIEQGNWDWFARSGSLVVVNGIILTSHQIIQHIHQLDRQRRRIAVQRDWADAEKFNFIRDDSTRQWLSEKQGLYMLIAGTLVWGFGDLINLL